MKQSSCALILLCGISNAFVPERSFVRKNSVALNGLFDGLKEAFSAPALETTRIDSERETPIDRWMGWSVATENEKQGQAQVQAGTYYVYWK
jgi:hypothetical protein